MLPTQVNLKRLSERRCAAEAIAAARVRPISPVQPELVLGPDGYVPTLASEPP